MRLGLSASGVIAKPLALRATTLLTKSRADEAAVPCMHSRHHGIRDSSRCSDSFCLAGRSSNVRREGQALRDEAAIH